jgi:hypothetical protein
MLTILQKAEEIRLQRMQDNQDEKNKEIFKLQDQLPFIRESFYREFADEIKILEEANISYEPKIAKFPNQNSKFYIEFRHGKEMCGMPYQIVYSQASWKLHSGQDWRKWPMEDFILFITEKLFK